MKDVHGVEHDSSGTMGMAPPGAQHVDHNGNVIFGGSTIVGNVHDSQQNALGAGMNSGFGSVDSIAGSAGVASYSTIQGAGPVTVPPRVRRTPQPLTPTKMAIIATLAAFGFGVWCFIGPQIADGGVVLAICNLVAFMVMAFAVIAVPNTLPSDSKWLWRAGVCVQWLLPTAVAMCLTPVLWQGFASDAEKAAYRGASLFAHLPEFIFVGLICAMPVFLLVSFPLAVVMYRCDPLRKPRA